MQYAETLIVELIVLVLWFLIPTLLSLPCLFMVKIQRRITSGWNYSRVHSLQNISRIYLVFSFSFLIGVFFDLILLPPNFEWLVFVVSYFMFIAVTMWRIFSPIGESILAFNAFLLEAQTYVELPDFELIFHGFSKMKARLRHFNFNISPNEQALGMLRSYLKNECETKRDINRIVEWLNNSWCEENLNEVLRIFSKYNSFAIHEKELGIHEKPTWNFDFMEFLGIFIVPVLVAILTVFGPKLLEIIGG
ncbi:MAG: hypothetical protein NWF02_07330 [Candidatus Bathyarchaeota archaeon]|nr:hypothetical protein [Candidatus Bathyarchaeum sp.]